MRIDPHSYFDPAQPRTCGWGLRWEADFSRKALRGEATLLFKEASQGPLDLDTKALTIRKIVTPDGTPVPFELAPEEPILGRRLRLKLPRATRCVTIAYETGSGSVGLHWLTPEQTEGKAKPFLFSQCQAIHARSVLPCQDCAVARVTFDAEIVVPEGLTAVMSAGPEGDEPAGPGRRFKFRMPQAIPSYLFAFAVGELESRDLSHRCRVWAEPRVIEKAAWEFSGVEPMIEAAETVFGPYVWDRFDMLVLPPAFPYGGMENPRMVFLTPTLLAGDRSLVEVVAHELAHSWTGNLVTNATAEHFWLNEGFSAWAERRILRALLGEEAEALAWAVGEKDLADALERFHKRPELTRLRTDLAGVDPDDAFSSVPYEKGARFVAALEAACGEEDFAAFLRAYIKRFKFQSITTEEFCAFFEEQRPGLLAKTRAAAWLHQAGMPAGAPRSVSARLEALIELAQGWGDGQRPDPALARKWRATETMVYLQHLPKFKLEDCAWLDGALGLTATGNYEILVLWLRLAIPADYRPALEAVRQVLMRVGRMKFVRPLYEVLGETETGRALAREVFAKVAPAYHPLTRRAAQAAMSGYPA